MDFNGVVGPKDRNDPKTGRTHAPGQKIAPLEKYLPKLLPRLLEICNKQITRLRKKRSRPAAPTTTTPTATASSSTPSTEPVMAANATSTTTASAPTAAATVSNAPVLEPAGKKGKNKKKKKKSAKAQGRDNLEKELDGYRIIESESGIIIEDKYGVPIIILVRQAIPPMHADQMNVCLFFFWVA